MGACASASAARVRSLIDAAVSTAHARGQSAIATVVGVIAPGIAPQLFFGGAPVAAHSHARALPLDGRTTFMIGSISKVFTSRLYAMRQGTYAKTLGDTIRLPLPAGIRSLPILDIAHYCAGFPADNVSPIWWHGAIDADTLPQLIATLEAHPELPQCPPGAQYAYSNLSWGLMGLAALGATDVTQPVGREAIDAYATLGRLLGLANTTPWTPTTADALPAGYDPRGALFPEAFPYGRPQWTTLGGGGNLASTGDDMLAWLAYNMGRSGKDLALLREQQTTRRTFATVEQAVRGLEACATSATKIPVTTALGWFVAHPRGSDATALTKNGAVAGFNSWMGFADWAESGTPSQTGAFVLSNAPGLANTLGASVLRALIS